MENIFLNVGIADGVKMINVRTQRLVLEPRLTGEISKVIEL